MNETSDLAATTAPRDENGWITPIGARGSRSRRRRPSLVSRKLATVGVGITAAITVGGIVGGGIATSSAAPRPVAVVKGAPKILSFTASPSNLPGLGGKEYFIAKLRNVNACIINVRVVQPAIGPNNGPFKVLCTSQALDVYLTIPAGLTTSDEMWDVTLQVKNPTHSISAPVVRQFGQAEAPVPPTPPPTVPGPPPTPPTTS